MPCVIQRWATVYDATHISMTANVCLFVRICVTSLGNLPKHTYKCIVAFHCCFFCFKGTQGPWNASIACLWHMQPRDLLTSMWWVESSAWEIEKHGTFRPRLSLQGSIHWALQCCTAAVFILSPYWEPLGQYSRHDKSGIHLIPKWRPIKIIVLLFTC